MYKMYTFLQEIPISVQSAGQSGEQMQQPTGWNPG